MSNSANLRRERIREYLVRKRAALVPDLAAHVGSSEATIRRDIQVLLKEAGFRRVRGGIRMEDSATELSVLQRSHLCAERKRLIGRKAAELIQDGEAVFIGSGSTAIEVARSLSHHSDLTVITNSIPAVSVLLDNPRVNLVVTGGAVRRSEQSLIGHLVEKSLSELRADKVIMGIQGIHPLHGLTNEFLPEAVLDRFLVHFAPRLIIVADSSKLGRIKASFVAAIEDIDVLVTDEGAEPELLEELERRGIRTLVADGSAVAST
jgi:DeoR/GlpR family transcriptional regulator of sugar metabolism